MLRAGEIRLAGAHAACLDAGCAVAHHLTSGNQRLRVCCCSYRIKMVSARPG